jgi:uncharacterized protein YbjT (DUF2867 family)
VRILVTGASGFVGSLLVGPLLAEGHEVVAVGREPTRIRDALEPSGVAGHNHLEVIRGDALQDDDGGMARALDGVEVAYYLIHSMERTRGELGFAERERRAAHNFAEAAVTASVRRTIYLGGLVPGQRADASRHLASREEVEQLLLDALPGSLALRSSIVIGARSRSFRLLVRLIERMSVLPLPSWRRFRTQPIDARDVIAMLLAAARADAPVGTLEIGGAEVLTYGEMLGRIAELMLLGRPALRLPVAMRSVSSRVAAAIAGEDPELVGPLMEGLKGDLLPAEDRAAERLNVRLHSFDAAVEHALAEWERSEPLAAR